MTYFVAFPPPAGAGSTAFAYTPAQYQLLDPALFLNAASRYLDTAQLAAGNGFRDFNQSAAAVLGQQASLAELQARGALLQQAARLMGSATPSRAASQPQPARAAVASQITTRATQIITAKCIRCHSPANKQGGLDLTGFRALDRSLELKMLDRITTADRDRRMPKGGTLTPEEIATLFRSSSLCTPAE